jgi:5-methylcytosine-specific restriction endonuclease McrA
MRVSVVCVTCGVEFTKTPSHAKKVKQHFCGHKCFTQWFSENRRGANNPLFRGRVEVQCASCCRPLIRKPYEVRDHALHFCTFECRGAWMSEHKRGESNPNGKPRISMPCSNCGATLSLIEYQVKHFSKHFCNSKCRGEWQSNNHIGHNHPRFTSVEVPCATCGRIVLREQNALRAHQFCDAKCMGAWFSKHRSGVRSHRWRGGPKQRRRIYYGPNWTAQRNAARQRDGFKCQGCGRTHFRIRHALSVHHIVPFRTFGYKAGENDFYLKANDLTNLICLCSACHRRAELGKIPLQPKLL